MANVPKLMADGVAGKVAIFMVDELDPSDRDPLDTPLDHVSRLLFHSDLHYPVIVTKHTGSLNLPSRSANLGPSQATHTLFAHGLAGQPFVLGRMVNLSGNNVALAGSVPVQINAYGCGRFLHLGANATNVVLNELYHTHQTAGVSSLSINWEVWVTDLLLS